jgi:hypothetical protein
MTVQVPGRRDDNYPAEFKLYSDPAMPGVSRQTLVSMFVVATLVICAGLVRFAVGNSSSGEKLFAVVIPSAGNRLTELVYATPALSILTAAELAPSWALPHRLL